MTWLNKSATKELWKYQMDTNSSFRFQSKVDTFSTMWRLSQERSGFDEAIYWIELLLKLGNFDHLKINDQHLNLIQYFCVDVFIFFFLLCLAFLYLLFTICVRLQRKFDLKTKIKDEWLKQLGPQTSFPYFGVTLGFVYRSAAVDGFGKPGKSAAAAAITLTTQGEMCTTKTKKPFGNNSWFFPSHELIFILIHWIFLAKNV